MSVAGWRLPVGSGRLAVVGWRLFSSRLFSEGLWKWKPNSIRVHQRPSAVPNPSPARWCPGSHPENAPRARCSSAPRGCAPPAGTAVFPVTPTINSPSIPRRDYHVVYPAAGRLSSPSAGRSPAARRPEPRGLNRQPDVSSMRTPHVIRLDDTRRKSSEKFREGYPPLPARYAPRAATAEGRKPAQIVSSMPLYI